MNDLTVLCVTRAEDYALPFLTDLCELAHDLDSHIIIAGDGDKAVSRIDGIDAQVVLVRSHGYIESVLDEAVGFCEDGYVLRLDDDERVSDGMYQWLLEREYEFADHWAFPRANLYPDENTRLAGPADGFPNTCDLWPDLQTRLSVKAKAGGRTIIHQGSPHGTGAVAPVCIEHHRMLVRSVEERVAQCQAYDRILSGAGSRFIPWQVPELVEQPIVPYVEMVPA